MLRTRFTILICCLTLVLFHSAWAQHPSLPSLTVPENFGLSIHFTDPQPGEMERLAASGVRWVRMDMVWQETEREKNHYDFSAYDRFVQLLEQHGLKVLFILDYWNPHYDDGLSPHTETGRAAFARWAVAAGKRYAGKGFLWELWNEPNGKIFWRPKPNASDYTKLALAVAQAFHAAGLEGEALVGPATYQAPYGFLKTCFEAGLLKYWSAVTIHPYRWWLPPETAARIFWRVRALIARYAPPGKVIPVLSGEWGYSTADLGMNEAKQARFIARMWLSNLAQGVPVSIWYDWKDDGTDPNNREHHFGIVRPDLQPKPAYLAVKTLIEQLKGFHLERRLPIGGCRDYVLEFSKGEERRWALWTPSPKPSRVLIPGLTGRFRLTAFDGKTSRVLTASPRGLEVSLREEPQYLALLPGP